MTKPHNSTAERLNAIQLVLTNTSGYPDIQQAVAVYGYTAEVLSEGQELFNQAQQAVFEQDKRTAEARTLAAREREARSTARDSYQELAKILRAHFVHHPEVLTGLELRGRTPNATAAFLHRARTLIQAIEADPDVAAALAGYNIDEARMQVHRHAVEEYAAVNEEHEAAKAACQVATRQQTDALAVAWDWRARFVKVARVALKDQKQLLEALGIRVKE